MKKSIKVVVRKEKPNKAHYLEWDEFEQMVREREITLFSSNTTKESLKNEGGI